MKASNADRAVLLDVSGLLIHHATGIDRRDWKLPRSCFSDDCAADDGEVGWRVARSRYTMVRMQVIEPG